MIYFSLSKTNTFYLVALFIPLDGLMKAHALILYNSPHEPGQNIRFGNNALGDFFAIMPKTVGAGS